MTGNFADLSHHQIRYDVPAYSSHRKAVALKATEGAGPNAFTDPTFAERWKASKGLRRIAYHFARAKNNGADEFAHCWAVVSAAGFDPRNDVIALDVEDPNTPDRAAVNAREFANAAVKAGLMFGLVYTYPNYADANRIVANLFPPGWRRLWYANYSRLADDQIMLPPGWTRDQFYARQYSDQVNVAGVGLCDDNRILKDWMQPTTSTGDDGTMAWSDQDSKNLSDLLGAVRDTYRVGFASRDTAGNDDPTHHFASISGVNTALGEVNGHLGAIHMILSDVAAALETALAGVTAPGVPVGAPVTEQPPAATVAPAAATVAPEMDTAPQTPEPPQGS